MAKFVFSAFADEAGSTLGEQISALKDNGISYIEPRSINGKGILELSDDELAEVKACLDENGIRVNSIGSPIGKYPITEPLEPHLEKLRRAIEVAKALGTKLIRMFSFFVDQTELDVYREEVIRRLQTMAKIAAEHGVTLCHENESAIYGQEPCRVKDILESVPSLYGIFDPANYRMNGADPIEGINATLTNLKYLHIKDAIYAKQAIVRAGRGEGRIGEIIDLVNSRTDDLVYLTLEPHLHGFDAYKAIDAHELRGEESYSSGREAFDAAAAALRALMTDLGYREDEFHVWKK